jgi:hypothetical protein
MEDALHREPQVIVVAIDGSWILSAMAGGDVLGGREQWFDGFVAENVERSDGPQAGGDRFVATGHADPADDLFAAEFLQIVSGLAGTVGRWVLLIECANLSGQFGGGEAVG